MDPLSITTAVVASLQVAFSILSCCYSVRNEMRKAPLTLIQIVEEVRELRNLIETVEAILDRNEPSASADIHPSQVETSQQFSHNIKSIMANCLSELRALEGRISPQRIDALLESKRKALLQTLSWRLKTHEAKEAISSLQRCKAALNLAISSHSSLVVRNIEKISISLDQKMSLSQQRIDLLATDFGKARLDERQRAIVDWLSPLKPGRSHSLAKTMHKSGTSEWFQASQDFQHWLRESNETLWLSGPPGSGKTVMMSHAIESLARQLAESESESVLAFVYCDFRDPETQNIANILGALLSQICTQLQSFPPELLDAYQSSTEQGHWSLPSAEMILAAIKQLSRKRRSYLFVDGIDEAGDARSLAEHLVSLSSSTSCVNVLATSRNDVAIQRVFKAVRRVSLEYHIEEIDKDIEQYIQERLKTDDDLVWLSPEIQGLVSTSLLSKSKGTFRWAACQLDTLSHCKTMRDVKESLRGLPKGLHETYGRLLARSTPSDVSLIRKIMTWLCFCTVPITLHQLWEALAIERGRRNIDDESRLRSPQDILLLGNGLLTVSPDGYVMLAHLSVRDYLLSPETKQHPNRTKFALDPRMGHMELALDCLTYLFLVDLSSGPSNTQEEYVSRLRRLPLLPYATKYWFYHALNADPNEELKNLTLEFFSPEARGNFMSWVQGLNADSPFKWSVYPKHATPLYYAASLGLDEVVASLLQSITQDEINAPGSRFGGTALHAATIREHLLIAKKLIAAGADPGRADFNGVTPLHSAASQGSMAMIKVLMEHGAPRGVRDGMDGKTPADWARLSGHLAAATVLDEHSTSLSHENSETSLPREIDDQSPQSEESDEAMLWQPGVGFFPNFYERRSGLDSSRIIGVAVGEEGKLFDYDFILIEQAEVSEPVW